MPFDPTSEALHYHRLQDATQHPSDPMPSTPDGIRARQKAITDGRLRVVDAGDERVSLTEECVGCAASPPQIQYPNQGSAWTAIRLTPNTPTFEVPNAIFGPSSVGDSYTDASGNEIEFTIDGIEINQVGGVCKRDGSNCTTKTQCSYFVDIYFGISIKANPDAGTSPPAPPNIQVLDPITGTMTGGISVVPGSVKQSGDTVTATYLWWIVTSLDCGSSLEIDLDPETLQVTPMTGAWTHTSSIGGGVGDQKIKLVCDECSRGGTFPGI